MIFVLALAAQAANTTCQTNALGVTNCITRGPGSLNDYSDALGVAQQPSYEQAEVTRQQARLASERATAQRLLNDKASLPSRVGSQVAAGKCEKAEKLALESGDFELAESAKAYCLAHPRTAR